MTDSIRSLWKNTAGRKTERGGPERSRAERGLGSGIVRSGSGIVPRDFESDRKRKEAVRGGGRERR